MQILSPNLSPTMLIIKATQIVKDNSMKTVVHLGGFHTLMSFVGSIGTLMDGSRISDVLKTVYGDSTIKHIQSGKAIARALRGHFLVESALQLNLMKMISFGTGCSDAFLTLTEEDLDTLKIRNYL